MSEKRILTLIQPMQVSSSSYENRTLGLSIGISDSTETFDTPQPYRHDEFIFIIEGAVEIKNSKTGCRKKFVTGDNFVIPHDYEYNWHQQGYLRKLYVRFEVPKITEKLNRENVVYIDENSNISWKETSDGHRKKILYQNSNQGLLANYAAGFNIIIIRPFVVGDTISVQGVTGVVEEVLLAYTVLKNEDGVKITIPNKHIVGEILHNSRHDSLLELSVGISYQHNPLEVVKLLEQAILSLGLVGEDRKLQVGIDEFSDSAITIAIRLWTPTVNMYANKYKAYAKIYSVLEEANITIPFPQRDLHIHHVAKDNKQ